MASMRDSVLTLCETFLPETTVRNDILHWTQIGFDHIAKDYGQGAGTTCGFLPHWLLWRLGCRDNTLVNRSCPDEGLTFSIGDNLSIFQPTKKRPRPSWVALDTDQKTRDAATKGRPGPARGDFVIIRGAFWKDENDELKGDSAHIFVLLDVIEADGKKVVWRVAQSGLSTDSFQQGGHITTLTGELRESDVMEGSTAHKGPNLVFTGTIKNKHNDLPNFARRVIGYNNLDAVGFGAVPDPSFTSLFENRCTESAINDPAHIMQWLGWWQLEAAGGFIPLAPTYVLLGKGHEAFRLQKVNIGPYVCSAAGIWTRKGAKLEIQWDDNSPRQSWSIATSFVPRETTTGSPLVAGAGTLTRLKKAPAELPPRWANT